jgi:hypothetical protein
VPTPEQLEKYRIKRLWKCKGKLLSIKERYKNYIYEIVIVKNTGEKRKLYVFECKDKEIISNLLTLPLKTILRVFFSIKTTEYNDKLYTTLVAEKCEVCAVNEEKIKRQARQTDMFEDNRYQKGIKKILGE